MSDANDQKPWYQFTLDELLVSILIVGAIFTAICWALDRIPAKPVNAVPQDSPAQEHSP